MYGLLTKGKKVANCCSCLARLLSRLESKSTHCTSIQYCRRQVMCSSGIARLKLSVRRAKGDVAKRGEEKAASARYAYHGTSIKTMGLQFAQCSRRCLCQKTKDNVCQPLVSFKYPQYAIASCRARGILICRAYLRLTAKQDERE